jgi:hypothetical protein
LAGGGLLLWHQSRAATCTAGSLCARPAFGSRSQFGPAPTVNTDVLNQNIDAVYNQAKSRLDPQFAQQQEQLDTQLRNQGFTPGTTGYDNAMKDFNLAKNDAYTSAMNSAQAAGQTAEANQYNLESVAYNDAISKALMQRELPLNEASALMSGGQLQTPSFTATPQTGVSPTDVTGAFGLTQGALNNAYSAQAQQANAGNAAAAGLAGTAILAGGMVAM